MVTYRVLIADDDPMIHKIISRICEDLNWEIDDVFNGDDALKHLNESDYQIFVLDVNMPGPSGIELAGRILDVKPDAAILILTGFAGIEDAVRALKQGAYEYIEKETITIDRLQTLLLSAAEYHENRKHAIFSQNDRNAQFQDIQSTNKTFQSIMELSGDLIFILNAKDFVIQDCNTAAFKRLKMKRSELVGRKFQDVCQEPLESIWTEIVRSTRDSNPTLKEALVKSSDNETFPTEISCAYVALESGEFISIVARDITKRKVAEEELVQSKRELDDKNQKLRTIIDGIDDGILVTDVNGRISSVNTGLKSILETPEELVLGKSIVEVLQPLTVENVKKLIESFRKSDLRLIEKQTGSIESKKISIGFHPIYNQNTFLGLIIKLTDVTELVDEREMAQSESKYQSEMLHRKICDLQSSIDNIQALLQCLIETKLSSEQSALVETIADFVESLMPSQSNKNSY